MTTGSYMRTFEGHTTEIVKLKYLQDYDYLISSGLADIFFWDIDSGALLKTVSFTNKYDFFAYH